MKKYQPIWIAAMMLATTASRALGDEESAVAALLKLGARITRSENRHGKPVIKVELIGGYKLTDAGLKHLAELKQLQSLTIHHCMVSDAGLNALAGLTELQSLNLQACVTVTDAGLNELAGLTRMQTLDLSFTRVTDAGLKELAGLKRLQTLKTRR
jgi:hypothetical protein